ncbi:MAG TPA: PAS domain S-box protein, partial [Candidatus Thermoplasmatota archaeon]|nr:PAS domain S-box protein [Candidatus Thermoplasmatota archaeon]
MGDLRFLAPYERVRSADDRVETLRRLGDLDVVAALAAASFERDPLLANVLATEAMNRMRRHGTIVETAAEGLLSLDAGGHVTFLNPAAAALFGYGPEELLGRNIESFFQPVRAEAPTPGGGSFLERVLHRQEALRNLETRVRRADGELVPVMASAAPILREGATEGAVVTLTDLSDRRRVEEALLEATTKRSLEQD